MSGARQAVKELADPPSPPAPARDKGVFLLLAATACIVLGAKLITIATLGTSVPVLDQWDGEAARLYSPYLTGTLSFADLFAPHNEHRIYLHRMLALVHLELAGEWNPRLEMILNAIVHTAVITWLTALLMRLVEPGRRMILACFVTLMFAVPFAYENTLWGFQSQLYFMLLLGLAALAAFATARPFGLRWWGGLVAGVLSYFSFATGTTSLLAAGGLVSLQLITKARDRGAREYAGVAVIAVVVLTEFVWTASGAHPMSNPLTFVLGLLLIAVRVVFAIPPVAWFCRHTIARRPAVSDPAWVVVGISAWVAVQLVLLAYGRGTVIAVRYLDIILLLYPVALVAVFAFADRPRATRPTGAARPGRYPRPGVAAWMFTVVTVFSAMGGIFVVGAVEWNKATRQQLANVQNYLATGNVDQLKNAGHGNVFDLSYPDPRRLAQVLRDPQLRAILPPDLRPPDADNAGARHRMLLNGAAAGAVTTAVDSVRFVGPGLLALGLGLFFAVGTRPGRPGEQPRLESSLNSGDDDET